MTFRVGQKVVCVDDGGSVGTWVGGEDIYKGAVYTIHSTFSFEGDKFVRLFEVKRSRQCTEKWGHDGYGAHRFRPIVERKTDISIFKRMLLPQKGNVDA